MTMKALLPATCKTQIPFGNDKEKGTGGGRTAVQAIAVLAVHLCRDGLEFESFQIQIQSSGRYPCRPLD